MTEQRNFDPKLTWNSSKDNIINDFYRPALINCEIYQRLAGYFSSSTFANVVNEMLVFIQSNGRIQLITSPNLSETDKKILEQSVLDGESLLADIMFEDLKNDPEKIKIEFSKLMAHMLTNHIDDKPQLEIKIAVPTTGTGIYHQKIGIMKYRNGERIAFAGSVNETGTGWYENIENFTVFRSWGDGTNIRGMIDNQKEFNDLWYNKNSHVQVFELPDAVKKHMLKIRPESDAELERVIQKVREFIQKQDPSITIPETTHTIKLRDYQINAVTNWAENNFRGLLEMATGTGKTVTAFGCINKIQKIHKRTAVVIACPQLHLVDQWENKFLDWNAQASESDKINYDDHIICNSDNPKWKDRFDKIQWDINELPLGLDTYIKNNIIMFVTHKTLSTSDFTNRILGMKNVKKILVVDEVHNISEKISEKTLLDDFDFRLGLSATPERHLDETGTAILKEYFDGTVYTLNLRDAIHKIHVLCHYNYLPYYIELTANEMKKYNTLTKQIALIEDRKSKGMYHKMPNESDPYLRRADLIANAENKDQKLEEILNKLNNDLSYTLIYCTNNPSPATPQNSIKQLKRVGKILSDRGITSDSVTWEDKTKDRQNIIKLMTKGHFKCITAVRCLDEGVDIPSVKTGIFMASSGNPKQFIQRRGRILRKSDITGKKIATIYDILVVPLIADYDKVVKRSQRKLIAKELIRHKEFASIADNTEDAIESIKPIAGTFDIDLNELDYEYVRNMN